MSLLLPAPAGPQLAIVGRVVVAAVLGAIVGLEREWAGKPAGLRTHLLIAAAACLFIGLGDPLMSRGPGAELGSSPRPDPVRLLQSIILGVSFLGAGTIVVDRKGSRVEGLTTAAGVLLTTGIGVAVALDQTVVALSVTCLTVIALAGLGAIESWMQGRGWGSGRPELRQGTPRR
jgi:putative Mg2+ transporter-C (MgtC) family protein